MYQESDLFALLSERSVIPAAGTRKMYSANLFFLAVCQILSPGDTACDELAAATGKGEEIFAEREGLANLFRERHIQPVSAARLMAADQGNDAVSAVDGYLFDMILQNFALKSLREEGFVLRSDAVCERLLGNPTKAIAAVLAEAAKPEEEGADAAEGEDRAENGIEEDIAGMKRILGEIFDEDEEEDEEDEEDDEEEGETDEAEEKQDSALNAIVKKTGEVYRYLSDTVYGQEQAISTFISGYFQAELSALTQKERTKPRATFLFAGPPGVGKTFLSEQAAKILGLPFRRFDMSEYSENESNIEFCGSDKVYKNGSEGNVTSFVAKNPHSVLLFDEVEKAHLVVIHLFLQILDAGRLRDNFTDEEVSFTDTILIFTTNAGKAMYEDESIDLTAASRKTILRALSTDVNPVTGAPMFPAAICSRFAFGNIVMFNRMGADQLLRISENEIQRQISGVSQGTGLKIETDALLPHAILFAEGGKTDARTMQGKSASFVYQELYELFRLMNAENRHYDIDALASISFEVQLPPDKEIVSLFQKQERAGVLVFADESICALCREQIKCADVYSAASREQAKELLARYDISAILCDITYQAQGRADVLNVEDVVSLGRDFFRYAVAHFSVPVYILSRQDGGISREEVSSLVKAGAKGVIAFQKEDGGVLDAAVSRETERVYQQKSLLELARANKVLSHKTLQKISPDGKKATIALFDFELATAVDSEDANDVLDNVSKPDVCFNDVIGAADAKGELSYFVEYLKNPAKYARQGVKAPKGILLYGPPGTGKTLLAKAMAGESNVTFIRAEGNQFLKRYVGEGTEAVHNLFRTARKYAPSILFIDEIDAIAQERGSKGMENVGDVLTAFLTEMDGFNTDAGKPVFVLAATNYSVEKGDARSLDAALLRRFDRRIYVDLPNKEERIEYIRRKIAKIARHSLSEEQIENIAVRSTGASLAELESIFELALRNVIKSEQYVLTDEILEDAFETFQGGEVKKWDDSELLRTARHEAGHALMCRIAGGKPSYLTIIARGDHGGYMQHGDSEGKGMYTKKELLARVRTALGGRAAEIVYYGEEDGVSTGASGDLRTATDLVKAMICNYGMDSTIGLGSIALPEMQNSAYYMKIIDRVNEVLREEFEKTKSAIEAHKEAIDKLVAALLEKNSLKENEIEAILGRDLAK